MTEGRIRELESIGFDWGASKTDLASIWSIRFQELSKFKVQFGHCLVPKQYVDNPKLGWWVATQRKTYRLHQQGKPSPITTERMRELESIGFDWGTRRTRTDVAPNWSVRIQQLCEYKVQFGHCLVPKLYVANHKLGLWVMAQRTQYRLHQEGKPSRMTKERIRELESIGFDWGRNKTDWAIIWSVRIQEIREFKEQFGHCLVPGKYSVNPKLGEWVSTQRSNYRLHQEGKPSPMTEERIRELESIGFDWGRSKTDVASIWSMRFQELCEFKEQLGHCLVPVKYSANPTLGFWVSYQRKNYRLHQERKPTFMTEGRIRDLESIGFDWGRGESIWSARIQEIREFKEQFGHCLVPLQYADKPKLGRWVSTQRQNYRLHQEGNPTPMTEDRIRELESIGFDWGTRRIDWAPIWSVRIQEIREFKEQFDHYLVPVKYSANPKLGEWVSTQRKNFRLHQEGKPSCMTVERIRDLESIGFD